MTDFEHLPGCNLKHEGGNWQWTCRSHVVVTDKRQYADGAELVAATVSADGPCTGSGSMEVAINWTEYGHDDDVFEREIWPQVEQALAAQRLVLADWSQRSQCQHPEDQPCPE
jgi:mannose/cellobiose epimerase-like protein (N-acyl-D-glucosamine 2-epimerase family)